jgi:hypothetical protein
MQPLSPGFSLKTVSCCPAASRRCEVAGIDVHGGFIVGFAHDDADVFDEQYDFIQRNGIKLAMIGMLTAIPITQSM